MLEPGQVSPLATLAVTALLSLGTACSSAQTDERQCGACAAGAACVDGHCRVLCAGDRECGDNDLCNGAETCTGGFCQAASPLDCDDANLCTTDACEPLSGCTHLNTCACTTPADCDDNNPCTDDGCNGTCTNTPNTASCADGDLCNGTETCAGGSCGPGLPLTCDDGDACTLDGCSALSGCTHANQCSCASPADCDDQNPCTDDVCNGGCTHVPNSASCSDGDLCNGAETCSNGGCQPGTPLSCDDGNPCTDDSCAAGTGCANVNVATGGQRPGCNAAGTVCSQADACNGNGACAPNDLSDGTQLTGCTTCSECRAGVCSAVIAGQQRPGCNTGAAPNGCSAADTCDGQGGCNLGDAPPSTDCSDGDPCSHTDRCNGSGGCAGTAYSCIDSDACSGDICDGGGGCTHPPLTGGACGYCGTCSAGACQAGNCPPWRRPPSNLDESLNGKAWDRNIPIRIGAAANGDSLDPVTGEASYRQAVLEQYGIVGMETEGIATLAPTQSQFESGDYDWRVFDKVVSFACANSMAVSVAPLFYDTVIALGGAYNTLASADGPTTDYWMNVHTNRVMTRLRQLTGAQCPDIQIYVQVVNEGIAHQEGNDGAHLWQKDNCWAAAGPCSPSNSDYTWLARAFSDTWYYDSVARATYGGSLAAKLIYNENGAEDYQDNTRGTTVYNRLAAWKSYGWPIDAVGFQGHLGPTYVERVLHNATQNTLTRTLNAYGALGFETLFTEVDYVLPFNTANGQSWVMDVWGSACTEYASPTSPGYAPYDPPNDPAPNDSLYNRHAAELVALYRACRASTSCHAIMTWGVFDHSNNGMAGYHCQNLGTFAAPQYLWDVPIAGTYGYGHPVLLDCLSNGAGYCKNDGTYYRKRAWWWIWSAVALE